MKARIADHEEPALPSSYPVYKGALLQEREVFDLMGVHSEGHPDLRRILTDYGFRDEGAVGYSLLVMALVFLPLSGFILSRARATFRDYQHSEVK